MSSVGLLLVIPPASAHSSARLNLSKCLSAMHSRALRTAVEANGSKAGDLKLTGIARSEVIILSMLGLAK